MNTWSCARCGKAAFADQNFCRACGTPREGRRLEPITSQVPVIRTEIKSDPAPTTEGAEPPARPPRKRPISLALLTVIAVIFLVLGGVAAVVFGHIREGSDDSPSPTSVATPSVVTAPTTSHTPTTAAQHTPPPRAATTTSPPATTG